MNVTKWKECLKISFLSIVLIENTIEDDTWRLQRYCRIGKLTLVCDPESSGSQPTHQVISVFSLLEIYFSFHILKTTNLISIWYCSDRIMCSKFLWVVSKKTNNLAWRSAPISLLVFFFIIHYLLFLLPFLFSIESFCGQLMRRVRFSSHKFSTSYWNFVLRSPPALKCISVFRFHYSWPLVSIPLWPAVVLKVNNFALRDFVIDTTYLGWFA